MDGVSIASRVLQPSVNTRLLLLLNLPEHVNQDSPFVRALEVDILLVLLFQSLDSFFPKVRNGGWNSDWAESSHGWEDLVFI